MDYTETNICSFSTSVQVGKGESRSPHLTGLVYYPIHDILNQK